MKLSFVARYYEEGLYCTFTHEGKWLSVYLHYLQCNGGKLSWYSGRVRENDVWGARIYSAEVQNDLCDRVWAWVDNRSKRLIQMSQEHLMLSSCFNDRLYYQCFH
jgi:hypothetical protein